MRTIFTLLTIIVFSTSAFSKEVQVRAYNAWTPAEVIGVNSTTAKVYSDLAAVKK